MGCSPTRKRATTLATAENDLADAERVLARLLSDPTLTVAVKNEAIPTVQTRITRAHAEFAAATAEQDTIPAKLPANEVDPTRPAPYCVPGDGPCRWSCGCSPTTAPPP